MTSLPPPSSILGLPKFDHWYPSQDEVFSKAIDWIHSPERFYGLSLPTGTGKSLVAILTSVASDMRTVILTATKGLQAQITNDFGDFIVDIRGQNSFQCLLGDAEYLSADMGPCHEGFPCEYKTSGCPYYDRLRKALRAKRVVTNYAYYMAQHRYSTGLGDIELLILDESHLALSALESMLSVYLDRYELESLGAHFPSKPYERWNEWSFWAATQKDRIMPAVSKLKEELQTIWDEKRTAPSSLLRAHRAATSTERKLLQLAESHGAWVWERRAHGWLFSPVWVTDYMHPMIYRNVDKIMAMSAVLTPKLMSVLAIENGNKKYMEMPSYFPPKNSPVIHIPTARINYRSTDSDMRMWAARIDQIIDRRMDRKGIVFTASYARRDTLLKGSRHRGIMVTHSTGDVVQMVNRFKEMDPPAVLVSPAVTSGWDFPAKECLVTGTMVRTSKGYKSIESVQVGDYVFTHKGRFRKVLAAGTRRYKGEVVVVRPYGQIETRLTPNHPVLVSRWRSRLGLGNASIGWETAGELTKNSTTVLPVGGKNLKYHEPPSVSYLNGHRKVDDPKVPNAWSDSPNFWKLVGIYSAEGWIGSDCATGTSKHTLGKAGSSRSHKYVGFAFSESERHTLAEYTATLVADVLGNKKPAIYRDHKHGCRIMVKNNAFAAWLHGSVGEGAPNKRIPSRLVNSGNYVNMRSFAEGLLWGDGSWGNGPIDITLASKDLTWGLRDVLLRIGESACSSIKYINGVPYYRLQLYSRSSKQCLVRHELGKKAGVPRWMLSNMLDIRTEQYDGLVHNLQVDRDESYCLPGLCVHNCEYIIIGKLPYPDTTSPAVKARMEIDPDWTSWIAMQTLVQESGRGTRSAEDKCEIIICDDNWWWFWKRYKDMAPKWFQLRVRGSYDTVPDPPR